MQASVVIDKATAIQQDVGNVRVSAADKLKDFNSAQRLLVLVRPDASSVRSTVSLEPGVHQQLPGDALRLIKVVRNQGGRGISLISEEELTDFDPNWYASTPGPTKHYIFDPLEPKAFDVYPPAVAGASVEALWSGLPTEATATTSPIDVDDIYEMPLVHLMCYLAYLRDTTDPANQALAQMHGQAAATLLGVKWQGDQTLNPATSQPAKVRPNVR